MKKYPSYKPSGIEWIGEIPSHWEVKRLKYLVSESLKYGANESAEQEVIEHPRYIRITDFGNDGKLKFDTFKSLEPEKANDYLLEEGDILFARSGATVGKTFQFKNYNGIACFAGYLIKASPNPNIMFSDFLYRFTQSRSYENWKSSIFNQATIQNIGADKYSFLEIPTPPLPEQSTIASYLDRKTAEIDELIADKKRLLELYEEEKTAIINQAVTKGIDPDVPMKDSGIECLPAEASAQAGLGEIPEHWEVKRLKYVAFFQRGHDLSSTSFADGVIPVYGSNGIIGYHNESTGFGPSLVVGRSGSVGEVNFVNEHMFWAHNTSLFLLKDHGNDIYFLYYLLKRLDLKSYAAGTAVGSLNRNNIHEIKVAVPPIEEQQAIVYHIETECSRIDTQVERTKKLIDLLTEYRTALISEVVTGKVKVTD